jgi:putative peptidoglycan lipid II flippase
MLPFLPIVALAAVCMGMLNARGQFAIPALAPTLLNLGMIVFGLGLIPVCHALGVPTIVAMAIGVVIGGLLQFVVQLPPLFKLGFRWHWERPGRHPGVRRVAWLMLPATVGLAATQVNLMVSTLIASLLPQGSVSWLSYAFRIMQLPIGVFGVALATVSLPALSRAVVAGDRPALTRTLSATVRLVFVLTVPAALWLAVMSEPVIALLYEHGHFHAIDTTRSAGALVMYCVGLPAFAAVGVFTRTFYALGDTRTPVQASFVSVAMNLTLNLLLMKPFGHLGLALATSVTSITNLAQLVFYLRRRLGPIEGRRIARTLLRMAGAGGLAAAVCGAGLWLTGGRWHHGVGLEGVTVLLGLAVGAGGTWAAMRLLDVEERTVVDDLLRSVMSRLRGR